MGGRCLCAPGWWSLDPNTVNGVWAECGFQLPNASYPGGSNLHSPISVGVSYYFNEYLPMYCACNEEPTVTFGLTDGWAGTATCNGGNICSPSCFDFATCSGAFSAAPDCAAIHRSSCNAHQQLTAYTTGSTHSAVGPDPAYALIATGPTQLNCVFTGGPGSGNLCVCKAGFCGKNCCPCDTNTQLTCGGRGECLYTSGNCSCPAGYGGNYCCPMGNNGTACGPYGTCLPDGTCFCTLDFIGDGCQFIDSRCPTNTPSFSCSGIGTCVGQPSFDSCLSTLNYKDDPSIQLAQFTPPITDEGIWNLVVDLWLTFKFTDISQSTDRTLFTPYLSACQGLGNESVCVLHLWVANPNNTDSTINSMGLRRSVATYILDAFAAFHPELAGISGGFLAALVPLINATSSNPTLLYQGEAALLCYPQYINWLDMSLTAAFPSYPLYGCQCTTTTTGTIGSTMLPAGPDCASSCPLGNNGVVCSGYFQGQFEGTCSPLDGADVCICDPRFAGNACQFDLIGQCYPPFSNEVQPCTANSHGSCYLTNPLAQNQVYACNCSDTWRGTYCEFTRCAPNGVDQTTECSGNGICADPSFTCSCDINRFLGGCQPSSYPSITECTGAQLCLPVGSQCEQNGIAECGVFTLNTGSCGTGKGFWTSCSNHGACTAQTSPALPICVCAHGFSGAQCQFEDCIPGCNSHSSCNSVNGQCGCQTMWSSPNGCTNSSLSCFCSQNLCAHGEPDVNGTNCDCDAGWAKDGSGHCTVVQCPFIVETRQGEIECLPSNPLCPNTNGLIPSNQQYSLDNGCCVNTCPTCLLNTTTNVRTCLCANNIQYTQINGICFSVCHGQPSSIAGQTVVCDCSGLTLQPNQFIDSFCQIYSCLNGGTPNGMGGCTCTSVFTGAFCQTPNCGNNGLVNINNTACDCFPPFTHSPPSSPLCDGDTCGPEGSVLTIGPEDFQCSCASDTLIGPLSESCASLNCTLPTQQPTCALCAHGSRPYIASNMIACNCSGTGYTGVQCTILQCLNGGTVQTINNQQSCLCVFPWTGTVCQVSQCLNGGVPAGGSCNCPSGYTGNVCQTLVPASSSSTGGAGASAQGSSSSSSAGATAAHPSSSSSVKGTASSGKSSSSSTAVVAHSSSSTAPASPHSSSTASSTSGSSTATAAGTDSSSSSSSSGSSINATVNSTADSSSSAVAVVPPSTSTGLSNLELYGAIFGSIGGGLLLIGGFTILAWQLGWGVFAKPAASAAILASNPPSDAAAIDAVADPTAVAPMDVGGRSRLPTEERFPLVGNRPPSTRRY